MAFAKSELDSYQQQYENNEQLLKKSWRKEVPISFDTFFEAKNLYIELLKQKDYKLRVEGPLMQIYSNDLEWLEYMSVRIKSTTEFWKPNPNVQALEKNTILINKPSDYLYKVTLNLDVDPSLAGWIRNNPDKVKAGPICIEEIKNNGYTKGLYFYVRDDKVLQLLNLFTGKLQRIDKLIYNENSDK